MKTAEEYLNSKGFYITNRLRNYFDEEINITDMLKDYATEAIKADRECIKQKLDEKHATHKDEWSLRYMASEIIDNLPIELP